MQWDFCTINTDPVHALARKKTLQENLGEAIAKEKKTQKP